MADIRELILKNVFSAERFRAVETRFPPLLGQVVDAGNEEGEDKATVQYVDPLTGQSRRVKGVPVAQIRGLPPLELRQNDIVLLAFLGGSASIPSIIAALTLPPSEERPAGGEMREHFLGAV